MGRVIPIGGGGENAGTLRGGKTADARKMARDVARSCHWFAVCEVRLITMQFSRRSFGLLSFTGLFAGCSPALKGGSKMAVAEYFRRDIEDQFEAAPKALDPILLGLLIQFLFGLMKQCLLQNVLAKHRIINRKPDSVVAQKLAEQIRIGFRAKNPSLPVEAVETHVAAAMNSFREASTAEIIRLFQEQQATPPDPTNDQWHEAAVAKTLNSISE
jgi:hypothetical protein